MKIQLKLPILANAFTELNDFAQKRMGPMWVIDQNTALSMTIICLKYHPNMILCYLKRKFKWEFNKGSERDVNTQLATS